MLMKVITIIHLKITIFNIKTRGPWINIHVSSAFQTSFHMLQDLGIPAPHVSMAMGIMAVSHLRHLAAMFHGYDILIEF